MIFKHRRFSKNFDQQREEKQITQVWQHKKVFLTGERLLPVCHKRQLCGSVLTEESSSITMRIMIKNNMLLMSMRDILTSGAAAAPLPVRIVRGAFLITVFSAARRGLAFLRRCGGSSCGSGCCRGGVEEKCAFSPNQRALDAVCAPQPVSRRCSARWETWKPRSASDRPDFRESDRLI